VASCEAAVARELRHVLEAILAGVVVIDREGLVEEVNGAACRMLERSAEAVVGQPVEALAAAGHALARLGRTVLATGSSTSEAEQPLARRGEEDLSVDVAASPLFDDRGALDGAVLVLRDRAASRRLERLEAERQRFADFGRIAAGLAHEIKNPLGGIRGAGELLAQRAEHPKAKETAELIVREATRIAGLVDEFMIFARGEALRLAPINLHRVLDDVLALLAHDPLARRIAIERVYDPSIPELLADADRLMQVFLNLMRNALEAMAGGAGRLTVATRMALDHRVSIAPQRLVPTLAVLVSDTGPGMDEETLREARTPFFTTRPGGTGLGLAVADYWVAQHLGTLVLESVPGEGTTARVSLPLRREP
jgi:two-component system, NtrC family, nitrogen regulation sensor histidine kinase GlnL